MSLNRYVLTIVLGVVAVHGHAATIEHVETVYSRSGGTAVEEDRMLKVHFVDVGGGDAIVIDTASDKKILIDGGYTYIERSLASKEYAAYIDHRIKDDLIDLIVVSHPDYDHFAGLADVLKRYEVLELWASGYDSSQLSKAWRKLERALSEDEDTRFVSPLEECIPPGSRIRFDDAGTPETNDDTVITVMNTRAKMSPTAYGNEGRRLTESQMRNSSSIVLRLDYGATSFLFTGDVNGRSKHAPLEAHDDQEKFMVDANMNRESPLYGLLDVDVLKVPHHGSNGSSSLPFLEAVSPAWAVISAGAAHGHPDEGVLNRLGSGGIGLSVNSACQKLDIYLNLN